jgi:hypothetical protein
MEAKIEFNGAKENKANHMLVSFTYTEGKVENPIRKCEVIIRIYKEEKAWRFWSFKNLLSDSGRYPKSSTQKRMIEAIEKNYIFTYNQ